jgi:pilus assembly protein CpaC
MYSMHRTLTAALFATVLSAQAPAPQTPAAPAAGARELFVTAGKSVVVDSPVAIQRVSVANDAVAQAIATSPREVLINGKAPGETSLVIWQQNGQRQFFDVAVEAPPDRRLEAARRELGEELAGQNVSLTKNDDTVFLTGTVRNLSSAERAVAIASTVAAKTVNLLRVDVPATEPQILIKIRFANVDRSAQRELGLNIISSGLAGTPGRVTTGQFSPPAPQVSSNESDGGTTTQTTFTISDALNLFFFRPDLNLGATIRALQSRNLLQILAEPNVLAINGHTANFLAGGEFPFPTLQGGGAGLGAVTIQFREFGVRIAFTPTITPRGTIRMEVTPEVSSLDFANGLVFQGFNIPALSTRRVQTAIELESGQSFAIGGMLDNRVINNLSRIPGLGDIPFFGKLFRSQTLTKNNTELIVVVTPEIVRPIPAGKPVPELNMPEEFMKPNTVAANATRTPGLDVTGPVPNKPLEPTLPVEQLIRLNQQLEKQSQQGSASYQAAPLMQFVPMPVGQPAPQPQQAPAAPAQPATPTQPATQTPNTPAGTE